MSPLRSMVSCWGSAAKAAGAKALTTVRARRQAFIVRLPGLGRMMAQIGVYGKSRSPEGCYGRLDGQECKTLNKFTGCTLMSPPRGLSNSEIRKNETATSAGNMKKTECTLIS